MLLWLRELACGFLCGALGVVLFFPHGAARRDRIARASLSGCPHAHHSTSPATTAVELFDEHAIVADLEKLADEHRRLRAGAPARGRAAAEERARGRSRQCRAAAAAGSPGPALRRTPLLHAGRDHPRAVRVRGQASLSVAESVRSRAHGDRRDRRLWPRPAGAGLRHRSAVPAALQADGVGRVGRRGDPLLPVGSRAEGRPRHALDRRMHPPGQGGHDDPHRHPGIALPARRPQAVRRAGRRASTSRSCRAPARNSSPPSSPNARSATAAPASRATWSSPTSRTARAACATCTRCSGSPNTSTACATSRS